MIENSLAGIVLTARLFNPSIFTETWLTTNDIIAPEKFAGPRIFSPEIAQFQTNETQILISPPKMQITFSIHNVESTFEAQRRIALRTVELLPQTPYQALGLNFDYFVAPPTGKRITDYSRVLLGGGDYKLMDEFATDDASFGRYFSKNYGDARLKLDIKPVKAGPEEKELILFSFNFHYDVAMIDSNEERAKQVYDLINNWDSPHKYSEKLVEIGRKL